MLLPLLLAAAPQAQEPPVTKPPVQHLVAVEVTEASQARFGALDLDVAYMDRFAGVAQVIVTSAEMQELDRAGLSHRLLIDDLAGWYARRLARGGFSPAAGGYGGWLSPPFAQGGMGGYYTLAEIESVLDQVSAAYPSLVTKKVSLGQSIQGREQWMVKVSDNPGVDENEPEVRIDALHHAREPEGMQASLWFLLFLVEEYGIDPLATYLVNEREIYFVLCVNPDGYEYNHQTNPGGGGLWRKNRRNNGGGSTGVDLNRNYPYKWGFDSSGSSTDPNSEVYRGTGPASEPEVASMVAFLALRDFQTALSVHTYSNLWLSSWGYDELYPPNWPEFEEIGDLAVEVSGYEHGPAAIILYKANGVTIDQDLGVHGTLSWTPEIGSSSDGFWPAQNRIVPLAEDNLLAFQRTALAAGAWVRSAQLDVQDAGDGDGAFEGGEGVDIFVALRNSGRGTSGSVDLALSSTSPDVQITTPGTSVGPIPGFSDGQNTTPLAMDILPGTPAGTLVPFTVTVTYDGLSQDVEGEIVVGTVVTLAFYDFEAAGNEGWAVGAPNDATTGEWTRVDPRGTAAQTEDDHTPGAGNLKCWVTGQGSQGGSLGENDVDNGSTTLISPIFDLAGKVAPRIRYWRWYSNDEGSAPNQDIFQIDLSANGGQTWVSAETVGPTGPHATGGWFEGVLDVDQIIVPTDQVRVRFIASDLGAGSIVEAAIDDVLVTYLEGDTCDPPVNYCTTSPNSAGPGALMGSSGSTDVSLGEFTLLVDGAPPNMFGLFFYGPGQASNSVGNGTMCIGGGFFRLPVGKVDGTGHHSHLVDFGNLPNGGTIANGSTWNFQFWYRDPSLGAGFNFSDGLEVEFCGN